MQQPSPADPYPFAPGPISTFPAIMSQPSPPLPGQLITFGGISPTGEDIDNWKKKTALVVGAIAGSYAMVEVVKRCKKPFNAPVFDQAWDNPRAGGAVVGALAAVGLIRTFPGFYATAPAETGSFDLSMYLTPRKARKAPARIRRDNVNDAKLVAARGVELSGGLPAGQTVGSFATSASAPWAGQSTVPGVLLAGRNAIRGTTGGEYIRQMAEAYARAYEGWTGRSGGGGASAPPAEPSRAGTAGRAAAGLAGVGAFMLIGVPAAILIAVLVARRARG